eukprot:6765600-Pyramimonas_sp.AAC.1
MPGGWPTPARPSLDRRCRRTRSRARARSMVLWRWPKYWASRGAGCSRSRWLTPQSHKCG